MTYRLEIDSAFNCRPSRGERRAKDGSGRLVKCSIYLGRDRAECMQDAIGAAEASKKIAPGYSEVIAVRGYDAAAFSVDPLKAVPEYTATTL